MSVANALGTRGRPSEARRPPKRHRAPLQHSTKPKKPLKNTQQKLAQSQSSTSFLNADVLFQADKEVCLGQSTDGTVVLSAARIAAPNQHREVKVRMVKECGTANGPGASLALLICT